ncbi:MAG: selenocysteine-specific translation elongation factor [Coriobacteriaceae bacterium]|nr:selenocysteine-specific translation elongation factor [Coriobacteriaceae bacterium]
MSERPGLILGTAGHIDHGKSSLIKALTGTDPDRLEEEKRRGITIELGFAQLQLPDNTTMGVVDVPGHERFVRQMISGSTGVDIALLCVAADDGIMPQTIEHLAVLQLLAIGHCVVAVTKADLVDEDWLNLVVEEVRNHLASTPYAGSPVIPTSSKSGLGFEELKESLVATAARYRGRQQGAVMRLPIDRVFTIKGSGTVVTGTLWSGTVAPDDEVEILPCKKTARVKSVQLHGLPSEKAHSGNRVALNLGGMTTEEVRPGDFLAKPQAISPTDRFDASFHYLDPTRRWKALESGSRIRLAHGTREVLGRILFIGSAAALKPGDRAYVQVRLEEPLAVSRNDRFIVRSYSPVAVIGGGFVLRSHPRRKTNLAEDELSLLESLEQGDTAGIIQKAAALRKTPFTLGDLSSDAEVGEAAAGKELDRLTGTGALAVIKAASGPPYYASPKILRSALARIENLLIGFHGENPEQPGLSKGDLLQRFDKGIDPQAFDALVLEAQKLGKAYAEGGMVSHPKAGARLRLAEAQAGAALLELLRAGSATPPLVWDLLKEAGTSPGVGQRALNALEKQGAVVRINKDIYYEKGAFDELAQKVRGFLGSCQRASAADLKEAMGISRKHAIPLLEYLDSTCVTRREGDERVLARPAK